MSSKLSVFVILPALVLLAAAPTMASSKGTLTMTLDRTLFVDGNQISAGSLRVDWMSHSPETDVNFQRSGKTVVRAKARMVDRDTVSRYNVLVTEKDAQGNDVLKEIRFGGKKTALVF
jgi:hypothetical protein